MRALVLLALLAVLAPAAAQASEVTYAVDLRIQQRGTWSEDMTDWDCGAVPWHREGWNRVDLRPRRPLTAWFQWYGGREPRMVLQGPSTGASGVLFQGTVERRHTAPERCAAVPAPPPNDCGVRRVDRLELDLFLMDRQLEPGGDLSPVAKRYHGCLAKTWGRIAPDAGAAFPFGKVRARAKRFTLRGAASEDQPTRFGRMQQSVTWRATFTRVG